MHPWLGPGLLRYALDVDRDLVRIFWIFLNIALQDDEPVIVGRPVEFTSVPTVTWHTEAQHVHLVKMSAGFVL